MKSSIFEGTVRHRRFGPQAHAFQYRLFMMYLDLNEMTEVFQTSPFWSSERLNLAQFRRADYLGDPDIPLEEALSDLVKRRTGNPPTGPIRLLTHLRYFGYCFNPVSFYFCFDSLGESVETVVAEVNNTPWGERHCYVLNEAINRGTLEKKRYEFGKQFHVSPFLPMDMDYRWSFSTPESSLTVHMENWREDQKAFDATLVLRRREITPSALNLLLLRFPLMTSRVIGAIYWNAFILWLKRTPFFTHPAKLEKSIGAE